MAKGFIIATSPNNEFLSQDSSGRPAKSRRTYTHNDDELLTSCHRSEPMDRLRNFKPAVVGKDGSSTDRPLGNASKRDDLDYSEYKGRGRYAQTAQL